VPTASRRSGTILTAIRATMRLKNDSSRQARPTRCLSDADKRAAYDRYGHAGLGGPGMGNPFSGSVDIGDIFGDLFGEMFSMGGSGQRGGRGSIEATTCASIWRLTLRMPSSAPKLK